MVKLRRVTLGILSALRRRFICKGLGTSGTSFLLPLHFRFHLSRLSLHTWSELILLVLELWGCLSTLLLSLLALKLRLATSNSELFTLSFFFMDLLLFKVSCCLGCCLLCHISFLLWWQRSRGLILIESLFLRALLALQLSQILLLFLSLLLLFISFLLLLLFLSLWHCKLL